MQNFEEYLEENAKNEDMDNLEGGLSDGLLTNNVIKYFSGWMKTQGVDLLAEFWNAKSDNCPLESSEQDEQLLKFKAFIEAKF